MFAGDCSALLFWKRRKSQPVSRVAASCSRLAGFFIWKTGAIGVHRKSDGDMLRRSACLGERECSPVAGQKSAKRGNAADVSVLQQFSSSRTNAVKEYVPD